MIFKHKMHTSYKDITDKLGIPLWWDENAVPRYCEFSPKEIANIYAGECVLLLIECQGCGYKFKVAVSSSTMQKMIRHTETLADTPYIAYGDPPNIDCCGAGATMSSDTIAVLQYWSRPDYDWERNEHYEIVYDE